LDAQPAQFDRLVRRISRPLEACSFMQEFLTARILIPVTATGCARRDQAKDFA
jgi:hypothetical protein